MASTANADYIPRTTESLFGGAEPTTWGIGTTGIAGPDMRDGKPAGTVFIGIASPGKSHVFGPFNFPGSRKQVRELTVLEALARLRAELVARAEENKTKVVCNI
ncbi:uncharacterized protein B0T15DRAFT_494271 [Chaetomium strumarium]|uniref:CinA C-terminal domain-containing protein n=1 Tax=Chaetomium strumarium TaxID=1170767 RepID=A0AAJ0GU80_9PEZI|nr:hypothetical protein B0T15DRAFT_494271 [Chaetomium strumarium]